MIAAAFNSIQLFMLGMMHNSSSTSRSFTLGLSHVTPFHSMLNRCLTFTIGFISLMVFLTVLCSSLTLCNTHTHTHTHTHTLSLSATLSLPLSAILSLSPSQHVIPRSHTYLSNCHPAVSKVNAHTNSVTLHHLSLVYPAPKSATPL
jgi:hypothetical protein